MNKTSFVPGMLVKATQPEMEGLLAINEDGSPVQINRQCFVDVEEGVPLVFLEHLPAWGEASKFEVTYWNVVLLGDQKLYIPDSLGELEAY